MNDLLIRDEAAEAVEIADPADFGGEMPETAQPGHVPTTLDGRPDPRRVRGRCPECGDDLVSNMYYIGGKGYLIVWQCWNSLSELPQCTYRRVL